MTNTFGPFLLPKLSTELSEEDAVELLERFARKGFCSLFREIIHQRAVEVRMVEGSPVTRWLEGEEAADVLSLQGMGGWAPFSLFSYLDGIGTVFTPNGNFKGEAGITLPDDNTYEMYILPESAAVNALRAVNRRIKRYKPEHWNEGDYPLERYLELHNTLINNLIACQKAGVIYTF